MSGDGKPRLYGLPYAEVMYSDPAEVYETEILPFLGDEGDPEWRDGRWEIEEWTAGRAYTPHPEWLHEMVLEKVCEDWDEHGEHYDRLMKDRVLTDLFAQIDAHLAKEITWLMAEGLVGSHALTVVGGVPYLDDEPMYRTVQG